MSIRRVKIRKHWRYQARVTHAGQRQSRLCPSYAEARTAEAALLQTLQGAATDTAAAAAAPATLRQLFEGYVADLEARSKGPATIGRVVATAHVVEWLMPDWLDRPVTRISEADLFAFRKARTEQSVLARSCRAAAQRFREAGQTDAAQAQEATALRYDGQGVRPATINRDLRTLRAMLKRARPDYRVPAGVFFRENETRVRWLRPEEELLVLEPMPSPFREMAKVAALTLMRQGEVRTLRREMVHLEQGVVLLPQAKTEPRAVILSTEAQRLLREQLGRSAGPWVFPNPDGHPYAGSYVGRVFRRAARRAGLQDFHFHDLRHHGATMALNRGFTAPIVMALGGWKTERMMRRYAAVTDTTLRAAAEAVSGVPVWQAPGQASGNFAPALAGSSP